MTVCQSEFTSGLEKSLKMILQESKPSLLPVSLWFSRMTLGPRELYWEGRERKRGPPACTPDPGRKTLFRCPFLPHVLAGLVVPNIPKPSQCPVPSPLSALTHRFLRALPLHLLVTVFVGTPEISGTEQGSGASLTEVSLGSA